ncbi:MAG: metallophosphoesterase [Mucilaginibacter sp.]|nr:metallophosphoesterase [Mucilaginibacter sp.]
MAKSTKPANTAGNQAFRFAHPFFTDVPISKRKKIAGVGTRMTDFIQTQLQPIPDPIRPKSVMTLEEVIGSSGVTEIVDQAKQIVFHATGDTGELAGNSQQMVADAMTSDYDISNPATSPAFFYHLGDVDYYDNTDQGYHAQFYEPYKKYPGKIIAIPGNHDGELFNWANKSTGQTKTLEAFMRNFCQPTAGVPPAAGTIYRQMVSQPGVYFLLQCPFVDIVGLYSNMAENPGYIVAPSESDPNNTHTQTDWLTATLTGIAQNRTQTGERKALIIAVHHPPFSVGAHSSSTEMLGDIDTCCNAAGIMPDAFLTAHSHNMQRYTRYITFNGKSMQIPFFVCGCGGRKIQPVIQATGARSGDHSYDKSVSAYGYLKVTADSKTLNIQFIEVLAEDEKQVFDNVTIDLATNTLTGN